MQTAFGRIALIVGPGMLVAATGVGAGDLATGALAGSKLGVAILWAVLVGAALKFVLNEGLARWQLATGSTLLEGCVSHFGRPVRWIFLGYLLLWSFFVGAALMSACGVTAHAICPLGDARSDKILYGVLHSAAAVMLVKLGGYRLFEKVMSACIGLMFATVVTAAIILKPSWHEIAAGLFVPTIPQLRGEGLQWTVALMGGIGGTVTVLCYGYWIREEGRQGPDSLPVCRIDLAVGYAMTALFGLAMVIIGSQLGQFEGQPATLMVGLSERLRDGFGEMGNVAKIAFLAGSWGAVFSSLLGVWQSVPYLFTDFWYLTRTPNGNTLERTIDTRCVPYRFYLLAIAIIPASGLVWDFQRVQKWYAIVGALFIPLLALALLVLNGKAKLVGDHLRNSLFTSALLVGTLVFFVLALCLEVHSRLFL